MLDFVMSQAVGVTLEAGSGGKAEAFGVESAPLPAKGFPDKSRARRAGPGHIAGNHLLELPGAEIGIVRSMFSNVCHLEPISF